MVKILKKVLKDNLFENDHVLLPSSFDIVGDIAVFKIPKSLIKQHSIIGEAVLNNIPHIKTVLNQTTPVQGEYRLRCLEWVTGEKKTDTVYRESGCRFRVDLSRTYVSPRLSFERMRVTQLVNLKEVVINMFAGVGSFSILIAKHRSPARVYSIDLSPDAIALMRENAILNGVEKIVEVIHGDAWQVIDDGLIGVADRVLMPLPERAFEYLEIAVRALKPSGGTVHYYDFVHSKKTEDPCTKVYTQIAGKLDKFSREHLLERSRIVRSVGPNWYQIALDVHIIPK